MSKIIRYSNSIPSILIGEQQRDKETELRAEKTLGALFPAVSYITAPDGAKLIPIQEVVKIESVVAARREESRVTGYESGYQAGLAKGLEEAQKVMHTFDQAINDTVSLRAAHFEDAKTKILELVLQISRKVTFDAVQIDQQATVQMITKIIDSLIDKSKIVIKVNPNFLPIVEQHIDRFLGDSTTIKDLRVEADPRVKFGGCFIETPTGDIDARLESQFEVITATVLAGE
ncbi:MAG: FliH/SctL family protein [candidate division Zixibacteria bacterium]|nr:FliH/SctL family protein [candidate division Zixibacteria bacterium]